MEEKIDARKEEYRKVAEACDRNIAALELDAEDNRVVQHVVQTHGAQNRRDRDHQHTSHSPSKHDVGLEGAHDHSPMLHSPIGHSFGEQSRKGLMSDASKGKISASAK